MGRHRRAPALATARKLQVPVVSVCIAEARPVARETAGPLRLEVYARYEVTGPQACMW
jgi:hypothetical protein